MATYSTWPYYTETHKGMQPQAAYDQYAIDAKYEIDRLTMGRAQTAPVSMADALSMCECRMVDTIASVRMLGDFPGMTAINNDGFSAVFSSPANVALTGELANIARKFLVFPVNLMFRGAVVKHAHL